MGSVKKGRFTEKSEYSVIYSNMRGVDFTGDGSTISRSRFAYAENMYRDYESGADSVIESIPGYRKIFDTAGKVNNIFAFKNEAGEDVLAVHSGTKLYKLSLPRGDVSSQQLDFYDGLCDGKSDSFFSGGSLYVIDGKGIVRMSHNKTEAATDYYVPVTFINGSAHEQRNLLSNKAYEKTVIGSPDDISYASPGLKFIITDREGKLCNVVGYDGTETELYIPGKVKIGENIYTVRSVEAKAFQGSNIVSCDMGYGIVSIGAMAFHKCASLKRVRLAESVVELGDSSFAYCGALTELHLGLALRSIGQNAFSFTNSISRLTYTGSSYDYSLIENTSAFGSSLMPEYEVSSLAAKIKIDVMSPAVSVDNVTLDGKDIAYESFYENGAVSYVTVSVEDKSYLIGKTLTATLTLSEKKSDYADREGFAAAVYSENGSIADAVLGCKTAGSFDGRIFLTGNPEYPGYCFYSASSRDGKNHPLYYGEYNYFRDGDGLGNNTALLAVGDSLAVFKDRQDGDGSIFYHKSALTDSDLVPVIYPLDYTHSGVVAAGAAVSFFDDPVFISENGILALGKSSLNLTRQLTARSHNVNSRLLAEDLTRATLTVWCGYLCCAVDGKIFLADSRASFRHETGSTEYEWYYLSGIGSYTNDSTVYRYSSVASEGFSVSERADEIAEDEIYSTELDSRTVYYTKENGRLFEVHPTSERRGGVFHPLTRALAVGNRLVFASSDGSISVFNNDLRGTPPPYLSENSDFDIEDYNAVFGNRIHPYYYSFSGHAPRYVLQTVKDNCSIPHLLKDTVKGSMTVKCKSLGSGELTVEVGCNGVGYREVLSFPNTSLAFSDLDFSSLSMITEDSYTLPISEKTKRWVEKQITLYSESYASPFGIYNMAYRFTVKGKIKK